MFRSSTQSLLRSAPSTLSRRAARPARRFLSTAPPHERSRSWKSSAARWGIAAAGIYWYSTSSVFAEAPQYAQPSPSFPETEAENENLPTIDELAAARKARLAPAPVAPAPQAANAAAATDAGVAVPSATGAEELEEEADSQGAFNPETGEINWDCPCLGGMAHGPCGPEFREAFSCFVYSKEEPKGMDCVDRFRGMQDCFRRHPDVYGEELADDADEDPDRVPLDGPEQGQAVARTAAPEPVPVASSAATETTPSAEVLKKDGPLPESEELVPRAWHEDSSTSSKGEKA